MNVKRKQNKKTNNQVKDAAEHSVLNQYSLAEMIEITTSVCNQYWIQKKAIGCVQDKNVILQCGQPEQLSLTLQFSSVSGGFTKSPLFV